MIMGFRFRKSFKVAPGVRINLGKRGLSANVGKRGASMSFGKSGTYANIGIPGTGLSYRTKVGGSKSRSSSSRKTTTTKTRTSRVQNTKLEKIEVTWSLQENGDVIYKGKNGRILSEEQIKVAKKQNKDLIEQWLEDQCDQFNEEVQQLIDLYFTTPSPDEELNLPKPSPPQLNKVGITGKLFKSIRTKIEDKNQKLEEEYNKQLNEWQTFQNNIELASQNDLNAMAEVLAEVLQNISWPRETLVSFDILEEGPTVLLDVDLPEIEDMPQQVASVNSRGLQLNIKEFAKTHLQQNYLKHIHSIGFRFIGEVFVCLPTIKTVVFSGYSQRVNKKTGHIDDEYLYSVRVNRENWEKINFENLENVDVVECFSEFDLRRKITKTGVITAIEPFDS